MSGFDSGFAGAVVERQPTLYTSRAEIASILSEIGIDLRIDDDGNCQISEEEECHLIEAIEEATDDINVQALHFYTEEVLSQSRWVRRKASYLAAHIIARRRGNPGAYCDKVDQIDKQLQQVRNGLLDIPRAGKSGDFQPRMSNLVVDRRYQHRKLRVDPHTSIGKTDSRQDLDHHYVFYAIGAQASSSSSSSGVEDGVGTWTVG